jgi:alcohol dehydrogenase
MIQSFGFLRTPRVRFGSGEFRKAVEYVATFGKKGLVVTGKTSLRISGRLNQLTKSFADGSFQYSIVEISGEPSPESIDAAVDAYRDKEMAFVLGVGGGSAIDAGKAISAMLPYEGSVYDYLEGVGRKQYLGGKIPYVAIPTTSGTGSEATANAVLSEVGPKGFKKSLRHDSLVPDLAIIDPELMRLCPREVTAACGMDALCQLVESYVSTNASPMTDSLALNGIECAINSLVSACTSGHDDIDTRASMAYASFISGVTLANAGLGVVHGIASAVGGFFPIPHGVVCGTLLAPSMKITIQKLREDRPRYKKAIEKFATIGALFGERSSIDSDQRCDVLVEKLYGLTEKLELPDLSDYGVMRSDVERITANSGNKNNPIALSKEDIGRVLRERIVG